MNRPLGKLLDSSAARLFQLAGERPDIAPVVAPVASLIAFVAADADDHVATQLGNAAAIRRILERARDILPSDDSLVVDRALAWQPTEPSDFRRERIDTYLTTLRRALIRVHTWLESPGGRGHRALLDDLWTFLKADAVRSSRLVTSLW